MIILLLLLLFLHLSTLSSSSSSSCTILSLIQVVSVEQLYQTVFIGTLGYVAVWVPLYSLVFPCISLYSFSPFIDVLTLFSLSLPSLPLSLPHSCKSRFTNMCSPNSNCIEHYDHATCNCYGSGRDGRRCNNPGWFSYLFKFFSPFVNSMSFSIYIFSFCLVTCIYIMIFSRCVYNCLFLQ